MLIYEADVESVFLGKVMLDMNYPLKGFSHLGKETRSFRSISLKKK